MNTAKEIKIILNSKMQNRNKMKAIYVLVVAEMQDMYFLVNKQKIQQQVLSEILYLFEKYNKSNKTTESYIHRRIQNCIKNCIQGGWLIPRTAREINLEYLENLSLFEDKELQDKDNKTTKKTRKKGWHKKTEQRFERLLLSKSRSTRKSTRKKTEYVPLFAAA